MFAVSLKGLYNVACRSELCKAAAEPEIPESVEEEVCRADLCRPEAEPKVPEPGKEGIQLNRFGKGGIL